MPIPVTCPGCLTRFTVTDKYAGMTGPCPKCRKPIKIPEKTEEIVIHAPEQSGPKDSKGRSVLKPLRRVEAQVSTPVLWGGIAAFFISFVLAFGIGLSASNGNAIPLGYPVLSFLAIAFAFPLVCVGYWFLHDDELQGFKGKELFARAGIAAIVFAVTWAIFAFVPLYLTDEATLGDVSGTYTLISIPIMIAIGTTASLLALELELGQAILHYTLYFAITFSLAWLAAVPINSSLPGTAAATSKATPTIKTEVPEPIVPPKTVEGKKTKPKIENPTKDLPENVPNLLQ